MQYLLAFSLVLSAHSLSAQENPIPLPRATPESQGISSEAIMGFVERSEQEIDALHSFILLRHGQVVAEGWWTPYDAQTPHELYSLSKSFTATAVGLAIGEGLLSLDDTVFSFFDAATLPAQISENLKAMRIRDLLAMTSGHQEDTLGRFFQSGEPTWSKTFFGLEVEHKPGTHFVYNTGATYIVSAILQKVTGEKILDYLKPRLFDRLGIKNPQWQESPEGITVGGWGLDLTTEDIARFGQLYLQKGMWNGERILSEEWVRAATSRQTSNGSDPQSDWEQGYGYQFWRCRYNNYRGDGAFGQYCIVMPAHDAVLAITSGVKDMQAVLDVVWETLLPAMGDAPLAKNKKARKKLSKKLADLQLDTQQGQSTSPLAKTLNGRQYTFTENEQNIEAVSFDFGKKTTYTVRANGKDHAVAVGNGVWALSDQGDMGLVAASGAWTSDNVYALKIYFRETPYSSLITFRFDGDQITYNEEYHVSFGETKQPQLIGSAQ